jgi:hypothetical protein
MVTLALMLPFAVTICPNGSRPGGETMADVPGCHSLLGGNKPH